MLNADIDIKENIMDLSTNSDVMDLNINSNSENSDDFPSLKETIEAIRKIKQNNIHRKFAEKILGEY